MFKERLKSLREARGLKQSELAAALGMTLGRLQSYEQGKREPDIATIKKFAEFLGCDANYLLDTPGKDDDLLKEGRFLYDLEMVEVVKLIEDLPEEKKEIALKILRTLK